jgi:hypothetical protein
MSTTKKKKYLSPPISISVPEESRESTLRNFDTLREDIGKQAGLEKPIGKSKLVQQVANTSVVITDPIQLSEIASRAAKQSNTTYVVFVVRGTE